VPFQLLIRLKIQLAAVKPEAAKILSFQLIIATLPLDISNDFCPNQFLSKQHSIKALVDQSKTSPIVS